MSYSEVNKVACNKNPDIKKESLLDMCVLKLLKFPFKKNIKFHYVSLNHKYFDYYREN